MNLDKSLEVLNELKQLAESGYKEFNERIIPTRQKTLGVRLPVLRKIAKEIAKDRPLDFVLAEKQNIYEMILLEGIVLSYMDRPFTELLMHIETFLDKVDNWAQVDSTICDFRHISRQKDQVLAVVKKWLSSEKEFTVRAGLVILLAHFIDTEHLPTIFLLSENVDHDGYYVYMANGWLISACMAKFPQETIAFLQDNTLDTRTQNLAIQKSCESRRVNKEHKKLLRGLRRAKKNSHDAV